MLLATLRGSDIHSERDVHDRLAAELDFGPFYGRNLAALWDRLSTDVPRPVRIVWTDAAVSRERLGPELFGQIVQLFEDVRRQDADFGWIDKFEYELVD